MSVKVLDPCSGTLMVQIFDYNGGADGLTSFTSGNSVQSKAVNVGGKICVKWLSAVCGTYSSGFSFTVYSGTCSGKFSDAVPAVLVFRLTTPVKPGTCADCGQVNRRTRLIYCKDDIDNAGNWVSRPVNCCAAGDPAYWVLQKRPKKWSLSLRRKTGIVVAYERTIPRASDRSFPLQDFTLRRTKRPHGKEFKGWPDEISITPDP